MVTQKRPAGSKLGLKPNVKPNVKKAPPIKARMSKGQILSSLAASTGLTRKQVAAVLDEMDTLIQRSINKRGVGEFTVPGMMKIIAVKKPARKARKGTNPFTGEPTVFKAKPASTAVKIRPLKKIKEFASS